MDKAVWELVKGRDVRTVQMQLALHCAPLITGLKVSNLLMAAKGQAAALRQFLHPTTLCSRVLYAGERKEALLVYRQQALERYLCRPQVMEMLRQTGYGGCGFEQLLAKFAGRYAAY